MKIAIGADHGGVDLKKILADFLQALGHEVTDFGTMHHQPCDYPLIGAEVAAALSEGRFERAVLICKTGVGMAIVANKFPGVRAFVPMHEAQVQSARVHNDTNLISFAANYMEAETAKRLLKLWLATEHERGGRHQRRVQQITEIEKKICKEKKS